MKDSPQTPPTYPTSLACPHCSYLLEGLPRSERKCPECGGELSEVAFAKALTRQMLRSGWARFALLISPAVGLFGGALIFALHRGAFAALGVLLTSLWLGAAIAVYYSTGRPGSRRPGRALLVGLPLGVAYFVAVVAAAVLIVLLIAWVSR